MKRIVGWDWEEFLQERATTTLKRSITLLQLRVLRLRREWSGLWPWVPATLPRRRSGGGSGSIRNRLSSSPTVLPTTQLTPAVETRCPADSNGVWTPEATGVIESMVQDTRALLAGCFQ